MPSEGGKEPVDLQDNRPVSAYSIPLILAFVAAMLCAALLNGQADLTLLSVLVLTIFAGAYLCSRIGFSGLAFSAQTDRQRLFPGETLVLTLGVENRKFFPVWLQARVWLGTARPAFSAAADLAGSCGLLWHQSASFSWQITALRRGCHRLGPPVIEAADIFGFYPRQRQQAPLDIIVYPRLVPLKPLPLSKRALFGMAGTRSPVQDPVYILGTRDYRFGRPARYIHWKASARHNRLQEKIFDPSEHQKVLLALDLKGFATRSDAQALEETLEIVASLAVELDRQKCVFGFISNAQIEGEHSPWLPLAGHRRQLPDLLELLARVKMAARSDLNAMLLDSRPLPWGTSAVVFSLAADQTALAVESYFDARRIPTLLVVSTLAQQDSQKEALPFKSQILLSHQLGYEGAQRHE